MVILVTGARGFIGSHLSDELGSAGHDVRGVDLDDGDLTEPGVARRILRDHRPELVVHLAAQVGRLFGEASLEWTIRENALMTTWVAREAAEVGARVMYASTSEIYGDQGAALCYEGGPMVLPHNLYGVSKLWGEQAFQLYAPEGLQIVRLSMPYGPGLPAGRGRAAIINMLWQANTGQPLTVHGGASRCWCYVGDTARGVRAIIEGGEMATTGQESASGVGVYNVGRDDNEASMLEVAETACDIACAPSHLIEVLDAPAGQTVVKRLSSGKLRRLGWEPEVELREGMEHTFEVVRHLDADGSPPPQAMPAHTALVSFVGAVSE